MIQHISSRSMNYVRFSLRSSSPPRRRCESSARVSPHVTKRNDFIGPTLERRRRRRLAPLILSVWMARCLHAFLSRASCRVICRRRQRFPSLFLTYRSLEGQIQAWFPLFTSSPGSFVCFSFDLLWFLIRRPRLDPV